MEESREVPAGGDTSVNRKHQAMLDRLSNRHQSRQQDRDSVVDPSLESTTSFLSRFSHLKSSISSQIARIQHSPASFSKTDLDSVGSSIADLEKLLAENSYHLPSYEVRASLQTVSDLKDSLDHLSSLLFPRKKFAFKNRPAKQNLPIAAEKRESEKSTSVFTFRDSESPGVRNKEGEVLVERFEGKEVGEFTVSDLSSCDVRLIGRVRTIFIHRLRDSRVYAGPVLGSILIDGAEGCVFVLASHQIRIHNAKSCDFYLRVRSRPIVEDCSGVRFAPYRFEYEGIEGDLRESNLDEETGNWANVDDFKWLRAVPSPNWSILPEEERIQTLRLCDSEMPVEEAHISC